MVHIILDCCECMCASVCVSVCECVCVSVCECSVSAVVCTAVLSYQTMEHLYQSSASTKKLTPVRY